MEDIRKLSAREIQKLLEKSQNRLSRLLDGDHKRQAGAAGAIGTLKLTISRCLTALREKR